RGERRDPGLIVVLRAKVRENRIRKMTLHEFGAPALPVFEQIVEGFLAIFVAVSAKEFTSRGRSAGARIEQRNVDFTFGKRSVDKGQVADDGREKAKTETGFGDDKKAGQLGARNDVAEAKSEKGGAAEIKVGGEAGLAAGDVDRGACAI